MSVLIDKEALKEALRELIKEEPTTFKNILKEIIIEEHQGTDEANLEAKAMLLLQKNFDRYDKTFKALA